ncbi:MAG: LysR family transcriptional regulator [Stellaceae bacterium]
MNRAAAELNTVQSNVTTRIRLHEEELGAPLFRRRGPRGEPAGHRWQASTLCSPSQVADGGGAPRVRR